jgi:16S rRNA (uracil1498-N3)-methyltransferase
VSRPELARRVRALTQVHVDDVAVPVLSSADDHHVRRVLRARDGEELVVTDGRGSFAFATVTSRGLDRASEVLVDTELEPIELYLAPLKGDRSEWALTKAVELGVTRIVPLLSERVVARWRGEAGAKSLARWRRVALEATGQCRRTFDPVVTDPIVVADVPDDVAVCEIGATGTLDGVRAVAVGPEGGWAPGEWSPTRSLIGLGEGVLRAETAAVVAATLLAARQPGWARRTVGAPSGKDEAGCST